MMVGCWGLSVMCEFFVCCCLLLLEVEVIVYWMMGIVLVFV